MKEVFRGSRRANPRFVRFGLRQKSPEKPTDRKQDKLNTGESAKPEISREQVKRLIRLTRPGGFEREVRKLPNGQDYIDRHDQVVSARRRGETSEFLDMRLD